MRTLVILLLLANLTLFAYTRLDSGAGEGVRLKEQIRPDKIKLLTPQEVAALGPYKMIDMDGLAVMKMLRVKPETQNLPVLMLTAMTDEPSTRAGFEAGVTDYVTKPFSIPQLTARVRACLARSRLP